MFKSIAITLVLVAYCSAKPAILSPLSYSAPLYAGSSQVDIRNSLNSGYATSLGYSSPLAARVAASLGPFAYTAPSVRYSSAPVIAPYGYNAPAVRYSSPLAAASPFAAPFVSAYGAPYAIAAPAGPSILL